MQNNQLPTRNPFGLRGDSNTHKKAAGNCASEIMSSTRKKNSIYKYPASGGSQKITHIQLQVLHYQQDLQRNQCVISLPMTYD